MDDEGVETQVVSPTPVFFGYRPGGEAVKVARIFNDLTLETLAGNPRLVPFCQVPLQDADAACAELDRCLASGHAGVEIGNHVGERDLDDEGIVTFLQHCAHVGRAGVRAPVGHAGGAAAEPVDGALAERNAGGDAPVGAGDDPRRGVGPGAGDAAVVFRPRRGEFPFWIGRADNAWHRGGDIVRGRSEYPPSHYASRFYADSVVFDPAPLRLLVDTLGEDRIVVGSDYPYPLGERPVGNVVRNAGFLTGDQREKILSRNAKRLLACECQSDQERSARCLRLNHGMSIDVSRW